jgi:hypothetical protein
LYGVVGEPYRCFGTGFYEFVSLADKQITVFGFCERGRSNFTGGFRSFALCFFFSSGCLSLC